MLVNAEMMFLIIYILFYLYKLTVIFSVIPLVLLVNEGQKRSEQEVCTTIAYVNSIRVQMPFH